MKSVCPECMKVFTIPDFPRTASQYICPQCGAAFDPEAHLSFEEESPHYSAEAAAGTLSASPD